MNHRNDINKEPQGRRISIDTLHLKDLRTQRGLSVEALSEKCGISQKLILDYEAKKRYPDVETTDLLANALDVTYEQLLGIDLTGYPSIDQPWRQYYSKEAFSTPLPEETIYQLIYKNNQNRRKELAIEYTKTRISYGQLFDYIERAKNSFLKLGVKPGDIVTMALPNIPENVYCVYGLNRIGAAANMVDLRLSGDKLINSINKVHSNIVVCSDVFAENIAAIQDRVQVDHWVILSPFDSTLNLVRGFLKWKNKKPAVKEISRRVSWQDFLKLGIGTEAEDYPGRPDDLACIFHTSGTTNEPKAVMMTNKNMNALAFCYAFAPVETRERDRFLSNIPPFLAYNTIFTIHMPLALRMTVVMLPLAPLEKFAETLVQTRPNHVGGTAGLWREFTRNPKVRDYDFSYLRGMASGNDALTQETKELANSILAGGGCKDRILEGYGMTEAGSAVSSCWGNIDPPDGSIGIPLCCNVISIFDPEDPDRELTYGEAGEICITGPSVMPGYYDNEEATAEVLKMHSDGRVWLHSGDLGIMKENGCLYFKGRAKRTIVTYKGFKIAPRELEQVLMRAENVAACCVVGHPDTENGAGQIPAAYLVAKDPAKETIPHAKQLIEAEVQEDYRIGQYQVLDKLPMTPNGKIDYRALEQLQNH